jgi:predicted GH43/DUF377 family glycosyl hydrolase
MITTPAPPFQLERLGIIMQPDPDDPREAWGVLNPGGTRGPDGAYYLFPRLVAEGNYSRIGRARVIFDEHGDPANVERLGVVLEPYKPYEVTRLGGGVEDPRVTYLRPLGLYVMTYTAYTSHHPRIALAVSRDLVAWHRLGPLRFVTRPDEYDLNTYANKDALAFPDVVPDPRGRPSLAIIHRPTLPAPEADGARPGQSGRPLETIWISFSPLEDAHADIHQLTHMHEHQMLMGLAADWENVKIGGGAPPVRLPYGWLLLYHGVSHGDGAGGTRKRYCAGAAVLALEDPTTILYRSPRPILTPEAPQETQGLMPHVVFPTATDLRADDRLDVYYGAADSVIGAARMAIPAQLPVLDEVPPHDRRTQAPGGERP